MQKPIKVLVIGDYRSIHSTRPEAEAMIGLKKAGFDITIMTFGDAEYIHRFRELKIRVIPFYPLKKLNRSEIKFIRDELIRGDYDILQLFRGAAIINGIAAARNIPVKIVLYRGHAGHINWYDPTAYFKYLHPRVDKIICLTAPIKKHIDRNIFFDTSKTIIIPKGHFVEWYSSVQPVNPVEYGIPSNAFIVISVAHVRPFKGIPYFIRSSYYLPKGLPIHFLMVGKDMDQPELQMLIEKSPYKENFHIVGFVKDPLPLIAVSDVIILTSIAEGLNRAMIEAMCLGVTPIITDIEVNKDLIMEDEEDLKIPIKDPKAIADAIMKMYTDPERCRNLGKKAKEHIRKNLNSDNTVQRIKQLYESLVTNSQQSS